MLPFISHIICVSNHITFLFRQITRFCLPPASAPSPPPPVSPVALFSGLPCITMLPHHLLAVDKHGTCLRNHHGWTGLTPGGTLLKKYRRRWCHGGGSHDEKIQYWVPLETFTQAVLPLRWRPLASNIFEAGFVVILSLIANDDVHDKR